MLPMIPKPPLSPRQKALALGVAGLADFLQMMVFPLFIEGGFSPLQDALDFLTALALFVVCGFRWQLGLAFFVELLPIVDIFPTWTAVVLMLPVDHGAGAGARRGGNVQVDVRVPPEEGSTGSRRGAEIIDTDAVVVPPVQGPPVR